MPKTKTLKLKKSRLGNTRRPRVNKDENMVEKKPNVFMRINNWLNRLTSAQFGLLITVIVAVAFATYTPVVEFMSTQASNIEDGEPSFQIPFIATDCEDENNTFALDCINLLPQLEKTNNKTNALLIGVDSREGEGLLNTDVIMVASYDHNTGKTMLISFPRDLYVPVYREGRNLGNLKINSIFATGESRNDTDGFSFLKENVEEWLDLEIHYTGKVNFKALIEAVDAIGGITIDIEEDYTDIYPYKELSPEYQENCKRAVDSYLYCVFKYEAGPVQMNGEDALIYSRMRKYSSDFDRARRQQEVINAIKDKVLGEDRTLIQKARDGWNIYSDILDAGHVESNVSYDDLIGGVGILDKADTDPLSVVLDPNFGGTGKFMFATTINQDEEGNGGIYVVRLRGNSFNLIREELDRIALYPDIYEDEASVVISNKTGEKFDSDSVYKQLIDEDPYFDFLFSITGTQNDEYGTKILVFNHEKEVTAKYLAEYFSLDESSIIYVTDSMDYAPTRSYIEDIRVEVNPEAPLVNDTQTNTTTSET